MRPGQVQLRPMNVGDLLDETFGLYRRNFVLFAGIVAVLTIPQTLLDMAVTASMPTVSFTIPSISGSSANLSVPSSSFDPLGSVLTSVIGVIFAVLIWAALARAISARYLGHDISVWLAYTSLPVSTYAALLGGLILAGVVAGIAFGVFVLVAVVLVALASVFGILLAVLGSIAFFCLGVFIGVRLAFFPQVVVLERAGIIASLRRSWHLVGGSWWRVFGIFLLLSILVSILQSVLLLLVGSLILFGHGTPAYLVLTQAASGIGKILIEPIQFGALTLLYYDLRVRKEALDLELAARSMETTSPT